MDQRRLPGFILLLYLAWVFVMMPLVRLSSTLDPESSIRFILLAVITAILFVSFLIYGFKTNRSLNFTIPKSILLVVFLLLAWTGISIIHSVNSGDAWSEWLRLATCYLFLVASIFLFKNSQDWKKILPRFTMAGFIIFFAFGAIQLFDAWMESKHKGGKPFGISLLISSSLGNKNFFAETVFMFIPFFIYGSLRDQGRWKLAFRLCLFLSLVTLLVLQTVSTWIALIVSIILLIILQWKSIRSGKIGSGITSLKSILITATAIIILLFVYSRTGNFRLLKTKITNASHYLGGDSASFTGIGQNDNSVYERILAWRNSLLMIKEYPLAGAGLNNWKIIHPKYGFGGTSFLNKGMTHFEHPHNDYLLVEAEQGIPGIVLYLALFFLVFQMMVRKWRSGISADDRIMLISMAFGIAGFMTMSCFGYPRSRMFSMLLLMLQFAVVISNYMESDQKSFSLSKNRFIALACLSMLILSVAVYAGTDRLRGEIHAKQMMIAQFNSNFARMKREADKTENYFFPLDMTSTPLAWYKGMAYFYSGNIPRAMEYYKQAIRVNPYHLRVLNDYATSFERLGQRDSAIVYYKKTLTITPLFVDGILNLSAAYFNEHQNDSAYFMIDRLYNLPMKGTEKQTYDLFLPAILFAKVNDSLSSVPDTLCRYLLKEEISRKGFLEKSYAQAKEKKLSFLKNLYGSCSEK